MKHFLNHEMLAPNVLTFPVDMKVVSEFAELNQAAESDAEFQIVRPNWGSDLRWISARSKARFQIFQSAFDRLGAAGQVREYLDIERDVRLYGGSLHTRSRCNQAEFHVDWDLTNNEAFTLLTPVCGADGTERLLFKTLTGEIREYVYKAGEAIVFGDHFIHSTPPGASAQPLTLLTFNFGTDRMTHWDKIRKTTGRQFTLIQRPDGEYAELSWKGEDIREQLVDQAAK